MRDDFDLTDEQRMIRDLARKVAREKIAPHAADVDERERYPQEAIRALMEAGLYGIWVPEEYGGSDMGCLASPPSAKRSPGRARHRPPSTPISRPGGCPSSISGATSRRRSTCPDWP